MLGVWPSSRGDGDTEEFNEHAENVELPVSWLAASNEVTKPRKDTGTGFVPSLMLYVIREELGSTSTAVTVVRSKVCPTLPEGLVEEVLLRLPAAAQARCRAVCKAWLAMLADPGFLRRSFLQSISRTTPPLCGLMHSPPFYDEIPLKQLPRRAPLLKSLKLDLSFLPEEFHSRSSQFHDCSPCGLMCITCRVREGMHVCVLNLVNQSFKVLPMLLMRRGVFKCSRSLLSSRGCGQYMPPPAVQLVGTVTATEGLPSFKVYVPGVGPPIDTQLPGDGIPHNDVAIYSSITGEWNCFLENLETSGSPAVACNGDLYAAVEGTSHRLVQLSADRGRAYLWNLALPYEKDSCLSPPRNEYSLVGHRGRLFCCSDSIWMLDDARKMWVEIVGKCPPDILPSANRETQFLRLNNVFVAGDLIVFHYQLRFTSERSVDCPVAYDMLGRFWRRVPRIVGQVHGVFQPMPNLRL